MGVAAAAALDNCIALELDDASFAAELAEEASSALEHALSAPSAGTLIAKSAAPHKNDLLETLVLTGPLIPLNLLAFFMIMDLSFLSIEKLPALAYFHKESHLFFMAAISGGISSSDMPLGTSQVPASAAVS